ncbi:MAG TPA: pyridoxamine 5'-phosphate oxidase family protein, partial [Dysgonamonadaceae bacterium]|nr:pyridoxamine 5'-phosphate oxidase family protein [Dysgonamonadaceae bacterium]
MKTFSVEEKENIEKIINSSKLCYVGMVDDKGSPYVLPMTFGYNEGVVYLHSAQEGKAIRILNKNPKVCIAFCTDPELIWQHPDVGCSYRMKAGSALCEGEVVF